MTLQHWRPYHFFQNTTRKTGMFWGRGRLDRASWQGLDARRQLKTPL